MNKKQIISSFEFHQSAYERHGFNFQRRYPNEEFCRFMGRNFFQTPLTERKNIKILEVGCGAGSNLFLVARELFTAIGLDISSEAIKLSKEMLAKYNCSAEYLNSSMVKIALDHNELDGIVDVFSSHCLNSEEGSGFLKEVYRTLKVGGKFFSYFPSKNSDTWHLEKNNTLDKNTLNGLHRKNGPFYGNFHTFRFLYPEEYKSLIEENGLKVDYCETVSRTYRGMKDRFEFVVIEAIKE